MVGFLKEKASLTRVASVLSLFTLVAYHRPFFRLVLDNLEGGFNGVMIAGGLVVVMLALNFLVYYLLLFLGRFVGKCLLAFTIGAGFAKYRYDAYRNRENGQKFASGSDCYWGITRAGITLSYKWDLSRKNPKN